MKNNHSYTELLFHITFCAKYRRKFDFDKIYFPSEFKKCLILKSGVGADHIHLIVELHPSISISDFCKNFKQFLAKNCFGNCAEHWPGWGRGYYAASVSQGPSFDAAMLYVAAQETFPDPDTPFMNIEAPPPFPMKPDFLPELNMKLPDFMKLDGTAWVPPAQYCPPVSISNSAVEGKATS